MEIRRFEDIKAWQLVREHVLLAVFLVPMLTLIRTD